MEFSSSLMPGEFAFWCVFAEISVGLVSAEAANEVWGAPLVVFTLSLIPDACATFWFLSEGISFELASAIVAMEPERMQMI